LLLTIFFQKVRNGACFDSGYNDGAIPQPYCFESQDRPEIGCRDPSFNEEECKPFEVAFQYFWYWRTWLLPALTEQDCLSNVIGRYGCYLPQFPDFHLMMFNESDCECAYGVMMHAWEWSKGEWRGGQVRKMTKMTTNVITKYTWDEGALSFMNLQTWLSNSVEYKFLYVLKSEALCSWNVVESNLGSITCDCVASDSPKGISSLFGILSFFIDLLFEIDSSCYLASSFTGSNGKDVLMGYTAACAGERTTAKDPSAYFTFHETSIFSGCVFVNISIIYQV